MTRCAGVDARRLGGTWSTVVLTLWLALLPSAATAFSPGRAGITVRVKGQRIPYEVFAIYLMPGQELTLEAETATRRRLIMTTGDTKLEASSGQWRWRAPQAPGLRVLEIRDPTNGEGIRLHVFVMVPATEIKGEHLNGYRIGSYPRKPLRDLSVYRPPSGFVEVTEENLDTLVSPHFKLRQFLCKQAGGFPKYVVLRERLLLKLEYLLQIVNSKGYRAETFAVLSGFRTPFYNHAIGNIRNSRHQWGGAADIFIDESPRDWMMDDLNADGRIDLQDATVLRDLFERASRAEEHREFVGGLGLYGTTPKHGPFVHVDARGFRARW